ncbi:MAG TPA: hypothetical protein VF395_21220 [Polyangiaceae bacterium]
MAAWSFPRKGDAVESVARPISVESLDGQRVRGRLTVRFDRPIPIDAAERCGLEIASTVATIMGEEICEGRLPFGSDELVAKVTARSRLNARIATFGFSALEVADIGPPQYSARPAPPASRSPSPGARSLTPQGHPAAPPSHKPSSASGVMSSVGGGSARPAADPAPNGVRTLWPRAIGTSQVGLTTDRIGRLFAPALRDSTAAAVFAMLGATDPAALDRLELIEGHRKALVLPLLRREASACIAAALYRVLMGASVEQGVSHEVALTACGEALDPDPAPLAEIQRYVASAAPLRDLAHVAAAALGAPDDGARLFAVLSSYGSALRSDLVVAASSVKRVTQSGQSASPGRPPSHSPGRPPSNSPGRREP